MTVLQETATRAPIDLYTGAMGLGPLYRLELAAEATWTPDADPNVQAYGMAAALRECKAANCSGIAMIAAVRAGDRRARIAWEDGRRPALPAGDRDQHAVESADEE